jgi:small subunit ribosomal protein S16
VILTKRGFVWGKVDFFVLFDSIKRMVIIRLQRVGRKNHAEFRVVVAEHKRAASKQCIEIVGSYSPHTDAVTLHVDKIKEWLAKGAQVSDTVHNILVNQKILSEKKKNVLPKKTVAKKEEVVA